jgi:hypothetical protein
MCPFRSRAFRENTRAFDLPRTRTRQKHARWRISMRVKPGTTPAFRVSARALLQPTRAAQNHARVEPANARVFSKYTRAEPKNTRCYDNKWLFSAAGRRKRCHPVGLSAGIRLGFRKGSALCNTRRRSIFQCHATPSAGPQRHEESPPALPPLSSAQRPREAIGM